MAESRQELVIEADVGRAQRGLDELAQASRGVTTAVENAGAGMKAATAAAADLEKATNAQKEAADKLRRETAAAAQIVATFGRESKEAKEALERVRLAQEAAAKASKAQAEATTRAAKATAELGEAADGKSQASVKRLNAQLERAAKDADKAATDLRGLEARIHSLGGAAKGTGAAIASFMGNMAANAASSLAGRLGDLGMHALTTAASFESMKTSLASTLGSQEEANKKFAELQQFAAATPFSLEEATQGFLKLKNLGLDASTRAMTAYGDMAGATGKTMMDVVEAVADAAQGEGERLKELGIRMSKDGDKVRLTFRGMTQEMKFDSKEIEQYLIRLGETNFGGGMAAQAKTLAGLFSSLQDGADQFVVSIMDSGITDALKSIMGSFSGMGETGKLLGDILGLTLGGAFTVLSGTVKVATTAIELFSTAVNFILTPVHAVKDAVKSLADDAMTSIVAETEKLIEKQKELDAAYWESAKGSGTLAADMQGLIDLSGKYALSIAAEGLAHLEAANAADRRMKAEADLWKKLEERNAKAEQKAVEEAFFAENEMGPQLPPGFKREKKKGKKKQDLSGQGMEAAKRYEMETRREREQAFAASVKAYDDESAAREKRIDGLGREIELLEARGIAERDQVDVLLWSISIESEAEAKREALIDARIAKEEELARFQVRAARTEEQREKARTRLEEAQHQARLRVLQRTAAAEEREQAKRARVVEGVAEAVMTLGEGMLDAFEKMAAGQRGAIAEMLADQLKSIARTHAVLALGETAKGIAATAMTWGIPNPEAGVHFAAAAAHGAVAAAAGVGGFIAGHVADARQGGGGGGGGASPFGGASGGGGSSLGGSGGSRPTSQRRSDLGDVEAEDIPISSEQARRGDPSMRRGQGGVGPAVSITINGSVVGENGMEQLSRTVTKHQQRAGLAGRAPRI